MSTPRSASSSGSSAPVGAGKGSGARAAQQGGKRGGGGRKGEQQDLNHLLGFTFARPASTPTLSHLPRRNNHRTSGRGGGGGGGYGGVFDRSRYVHTFRFVVRPDGDYAPHLHDPDVHLDWPDILQVILPVSNSSGGARVDQAKEGGKPACPICLSEPTAARMTKCGHVFCYPCILHYLALAEPGIKFRKCPVCHDSIYAKELKSVKWLDASSSSSSAAPSASTSVPPPPPLSVDPSIDADLARALELSRLDSAPPAAPSSSSNGRKPFPQLSLTLLRRPPTSTLALPFSSTYPSRAIPPHAVPWNFTPSAPTFAKFVLGEPSYIRESLLEQANELQRELDGLKGMRGTDEELGIVFLREALRRVKEQVEATETMKSTPVMTARKRAIREIEEVLEQAAAAPAAVPLVSAEEKAEEVSMPQPQPQLDNGPVPMEFLAARSGTPMSLAAAAGAAPFVPSSAATAPSPAPPPASSAPPKRNRRGSALSSVSSTSAEPKKGDDEDDSYFFYQSSSGSYTFLTPLDTRILRLHFGSYASLPRTLSIGIEGSDSGSITPELRKRCKWISHLPLGAECVFVEADLSSVLPRAALRPFEAQLQQRRKKRRERERRENQAAERAEKAAKEALPIYQSTYEGGSELPFSWASAGAWEDTQAFPAPPSSAPSRPQTTPPAPSAPSYSRPSFASALHAPSGSRSYSSSSGWGAHAEEDYDAWGNLEEELGRQRASPGGGGGAGGGASGAQTPRVSVEGGGGKNGGKRGKKKGITLSLTGGARG
ncbi:hypothetical protein JCM10213_005890 [Rhodosporidiobolus nylandii]